MMMSRNNLKKEEKSKENNGSGEMFFFFHKNRAKIIPQALNLKSHLNEIPTRNFLSINKFDSINQIIKFITFVIFNSLAGTKTAVQFALGSN